MSANVSVPYLGGENLRFTVEGMEDDESPEDSVEAVRNFLSLPENDRQEATPYVFQNHRRFVKAVSIGDVPRIYGIQSPILFGA